MTKRQRRGTFEINPYYDYSVVYDKNDIEQDEEEEYSPLADDEGILEGTNIPAPFLYPFTSKLKYKQHFPHRPIIKDTKLSSLKKFQHPYFSPHFNYF
jgi:hypothetical protein